MKTIVNFDQLNNLTGSANGETFTDEQGVRNYFTVENMETRFGSQLAGERPSQATLTGWADVVIEHKWHWQE